MSARERMPHGDLYWKLNWPRLD